MEISWKHFVFLENFRVLKFWYFLWSQITWHYALCNLYSTTGSVSEDDGADPKTKISMFMEQHKTKHILDNVKYAVFALGSRAYPHFCEFGHNVDYSLGNLGADQIISCGEGDELSGQDESFHEWSQNCFVVIYFYII